MKGVFMKQVLYYPGILIPNDWLKKTILYSDKISSIYPYTTVDVDFDKHEQIDLANMNYLKSVGIYNYKRPEELDFRSHKRVHSKFSTALNKTSLEEVRNRFNEQGIIYKIYKSKMND